MPECLLFLPWVQLSGPTEIGPIRLLSYVRGRLPGDLPHVAQVDIDGVIAAYATRPGHPVERATIVEYGTWLAGQDAAGLEPELFRLRELIAFAALAERRLFRGHTGYCNFDAYAMVLQRFTAGSTGSFSFTTRRRDGGTTQLWDTHEFAFVRPIHVPNHISVKLHESLLIGLLDAAPLGSNLFSAIADFNRANTDSPDVPQHLELVMMKAAFEFLLDIGHRDDDFAAALNSRIPARSEDRAAKGPMLDRWREARPKAGLPLEAWAREFCDWRGGAAHGKQRGGDRFVWSEMAHLAFASILFPLLVYDELVRTGKIAANEKKALELEFVEDYLMHDPFSEDSFDNRRVHVWSAVYSERVLGEVIRRELRKIVDRAVER